MDLRFDAIPPDLDTSVRHFDGDGYFFLRLQPPHKLSVRLRFFIFDSSYYRRLLRIAGPLDDEEKAKHQKNPKNDIQNPPKRY